MTINITKKTKSANSLLPLGAAFGSLVTIGLLVWFSQDYQLTKPEKVDPFQVEQEKMSSMLNNINKNIEKAQQMKATKQDNQAITQKEKL